VRPERASGARRRVRCLGVRLTDEGGRALRWMGFVCGAVLVLSGCGNGEDLGDMTAAEAKLTCLDHTQRVASPEDVRSVVTHKDDRYWDVLLGLDPPQNLVWCTVNASNGDVVHWSHGYTRTAAKKVLRGEIWNDSHRGRRPRGVHRLTSILGIRTLGLRQIRKRRTTVGAGDVHNK
jgi:hypothetical protein